MQAEQDSPPYGKVVQKMDDKENGVDSNDLLDFIKRHVSDATTIINTEIFERWKRSLNAVHNEHYDRSKFRTKRYKSRSRIFKPKSRTVLMKKLSDVHDALFSTVDYVHVQSEHDNPLMKAGAAVIKQLLNIFLDKSSTKSGFNWFLTCMGAAENAVVQGVVISKQFWKYEKQTVIYKSPDGTATEKDVVTADHPVVEVIPPEDFIIDPAANWTDPAQSAMWISVGHPMHVEDVLFVCQNSKEGPGQWLRNIDRTMLESNSFNEDRNASDVRQSRDSQATGKDRYENYYDKKSKIVWCRENFVRMNGMDYHFWSIGTMQLLSKPAPTAQVYPEQHGKRPYHMGYGSVDAHSIFPMSVIDSIQPNQQEINELTNLALDAAKIANRPVVMATRGKRIDMKQIQDRTAESVILVDDPEKDIVFDKPAPPDYSIFQSMNILNNEADDLAGVFSESSVANNRSLNETVGGMNLLSQSANKLSTLHTAIFINTWVEPVMQQIVNLIQKYADDSHLISVAGERAQIFKYYQVETVDDAMLQAAVTVRVDYGNGSQDPLMRMQRLMQAAAALGQLFPQVVAAFDIEEFVSVVMGAAGDRDGRRFVKSDVLEMIQGQMVEMIGKDPEAEREKMRLETDRQNKQLGVEGDLKKAEMDNQTKVLIKQLEIESDKDIEILKSRDSFFSLMFDTINNAEKNKADMDKAKENKKDSSDGGKSKPKTSN